MAKKRLKIKDKQGNIVDYDISAASVTIDIEGKSLDVKLSEIAAALLQSVTEVTFNGTPHNRENGKINLGNQMQPDWSESSQTYPSYIRNKPNVVTGIKVGASGSTITPNNGVVVLPESGGTVECDQSMSSTSENPVQNKVIKAYVDNLIAGLVNGAPAALDTLNELSAALGNDSNFAATITNALAAKVDKVTGYGLSKNDYTDAEKAKVASAIQGVIVGSTEVTPDGNNKVTIPAGVDGITPHIGANGNWWLGPETDPNNNTGVKAQGPAGTSYTSADLEIGNALNGQGDVLGMNGAMKLKNNIDAVQANLVKLYNKLANMAFWDSTDQADAEPLPTLLDWSVPQVTLTIVNNIVGNATIKVDGITVSGQTIKVDKDKVVDISIEIPSGGTASNIGIAAGGTALVVTESGGVYSASTTASSNLTLTFSGTVTSPTIISKTIVQGQRAPSSGGSLQANTKRATMDYLFTRAELEGLSKINTPSGYYHTMMALASTDQTWDSSQYQGTEWSNNTDDSMTLPSDSKWQYFSFNFKRQDEGDVTNEDLATLTAGTYLTIMPSLNND